MVGEKRVSCSSQSDQNMTAQLWPSHELFSLLHWTDFSPDSLFCSNEIRQTCEHYLHYLQSLTNSKIL